MLAIDDELYETSAQGTVRDLRERRAIDVTLCQQGQENAELELGSGSHRVEAGDAGPLAVTDVTLTRGTVSEPSATNARELRIQDWLGDRREVSAGSGAASYLTTYENFNDGWKATLNGDELTPVRLDGWQQGWQIPGGEGGTVKLSYEPSVAYEAGLIGSGAGLAVLIGLVVWRRRAPNPDEPQAVPPGPGFWLGTVALTLVAAVIAGVLALIVPVLALLAWKRHALLVPIAFLALAGAGIVAATGAGEAAAADQGAFGPEAQVLALVGLFAGLVSAGRRQSVRPAPAAPAGPGGGGPGTLQLGVVPGAPGAEPPTQPLPQRRRGASPLGDPAAQPDNGDGPGRGEAT